MLKKIVKNIQHKYKFMSKYAHFLIISRAINAPKATSLIRLKLDLGRGRNKLCDLPCLCLRPILLSSEIFYYRK